MDKQAVAKPAEKRVAITVYMSQSLADLIVKGYAAALLNGYTGTKQAFLTQLLTSALAEKEV